MKKYISHFIFIHWKSHLLYIFNFPRNKEIFFKFYFFFFFLLNCLLLKQNLLGKDTSILVIFVSKKRKNNFLVWNLNLKIYIPNKFYLFNQQSQQKIKIAYDKYFLSKILKSISLKNEKRLFLFFYFEFLSEHL